MTHLVLKNRLGIVRQDRAAYRAVIELRRGGHSDMHNWCIALWLRSMQRGCVGRRGVLKTTKRSWQNSHSGCAMALLSTVQVALEEAHLRREQAKHARRMALRFSRDAVAGPLDACASELDQIAAELESWAKTAQHH
jgi:hypothetical protein